MSVVGKILAPNELSIGDVLLCYRQKNSDLIAKAIRKTTGSEYCHAAIYYGENMAAESMLKHGVKKGGIGKISVSLLIERYDHVAVLRQRDAWSNNDRVKNFQQFVDEVIAKKPGYNLSGAINFSRKKTRHEATTQEKLEAHFSSDLQPVPVMKQSYFCSEFVADCFIAAGFIEPSAAILYQSDTYSPGDLGKDATFGTFCGYMSAKDNYKLPSSDYFYQE
ncbi:MAG: hypothetical protein ABJ013_16160 [Halioglobus sp.]